MNIMEREMNKRPTSITVIAWISIIMGGLFLIWITISLIKGLISPSQTSPLIEYALMYAGALSYLVSGIAILRAQNWARFLFVIWQVIYFTIRMVRIPFTTSMIPAVFIFLITPAFFLFRPRANDYFAGREAKEGKSKIITGSDERLKGGRKVISIICYVISAFFFYLMAILALVNKPWIFFKLALLGGFSLLALLFLVLGLTSARFQNWYRHVGLVCTWAAGYTISGIIFLWCLLADPKTSKSFPDNFLEGFNAYISGVIYLLFLGTVGILFLIISRKKVQPSSGPDGDANGLRSTPVS
jgi:hypothetical protein